jgi:putative sigma-54 modulation protein
MPIEVTARHLNISPELQAYARGKAEQIVGDFPKAEFVHVVLDLARHQFRAEVVVQHKGMPRVGVAEATDSMVSSIDQAVDKVMKQLRKHREKVVDAHHHPQ